MEGLLLLLVLVLLLAPVGVLILFAQQSELRRRIAAIEAALAEPRHAAPSAAGSPAELAAEPEPVEPGGGDRQRERGEASAWLRSALARAEAAEAPPVDAEPADDLAPEEPEEERETLGALFERLVAGRLLVWVGGAALVVSALLLIRYSIEVGLLTPAARMTGAAVFGLLLVAAGEYARVGRWLSDDIRVSQALIGAGIVVLYATPYGSHVLYGLIDARAASLAMVVVSAAALVLSLRHGAATALMGLIGGFLTPALVGDPDAGAVPLLVYLTLLNGAVFGIAWRRGWTWLAAVAVALSFLWTLSLLGRPPADAIAAGFFVAALAVAASLLRLGGGRGIGYVQPLGVGLLQLTVLVGRTDLGASAWILFGALAAASVALSLLRGEHRIAAPAALALALLAIGIKALDRDPFVPWAAVATTFLFAAVWAPLAPRDDRLVRTIMAAAALAGPVFLLRLLWPELVEPEGWGLLTLGLAAAAFFLAWLQRAEAGKESPADIPLSLAAAAAAALLGVAAFDLLPVDLVAAAWVAAAIVLALGGRGLGEPGFALVALVAAAFGAGRGAAMVPELWDTASASLLGAPAIARALPTPELALLALALPGALLLLLGPLLHAPPRGARRALAATAGLFGLAALYVLAKQVFGIDDQEDFQLRGFGERVAITQSLFAIGWLLAGRRLPLGWFDRDQAAWLGSVVTFVAALRLIWFDMFLHNPWLDGQWVGTMPVLNLVAPAYLLSAFWLYEARRRADAETRSGFWFAAFLAALVLGVALIVRQLFQGPWLDGPDMPIAEVYGYSLAGLLLSVALLLGGIRLKDKAVRLAGLALLTATIVKVFGSDAQALEGLLRILSFFGLGIGLIGVALLYGPVLRAESKAGRSREGEPAAGN